MQEERKCSFQPHGSQRGLAIDFHLYRYLNFLCLRTTTTSTASTIDMMFSETGDMKILKTKGAED